MGNEIPKLSPARVPKKVAMPRFRRKQPVVTLTEAVHRVLVRALNNYKPFAVFVVNGRPLLSSLGTEKYESHQRRWGDNLVAVYGPGAKVADVVDDLRDHFNDEVAHDVD